MRDKLTKTRISSEIALGLPPGKTRKIVWDAVAGLGLKIRQGGSASWVYVYRPKGAGRAHPSRTLTLGRWPEVSIEDARDAAAKYAGERAQGGDPAKKVAKARMRARWTITAAIDAYADDLRRRKYKNQKTATSALRRGLAAIKGREVADTTRKDIVDRVEALANAGKPGAAADLRKHSRVFLDYCVDRGFLTANPLAGLRLPRKTNSERLEAEERGRALDDNEIAVVWFAAGNLGAFGGMVRLGLLTGMRRGELAGLCWPDILDDRLVIKAERAKTARQHEVPLTNLMRAVISAQPRGTGEFIFPSSRRRTPTKMSGWTQLVENLVVASGVKLTLHDLRRTCRTLMSRNGISEPDAELAIGHAPAALVRIYNKDTAWTARVAAFEAVSKHVAELPPPGGGNVVSLTSASDDETILPFTKSKRKIGV